MTILVEEEKKPKNWFAIGVGVVVVVVIFTAGYYFFFKKPELIEIVTPTELNRINQISRVSFDPESVLNSPNFKLLKRFDRDVEAPRPGRSNPFQPF